jgi:nickel-type superoxide dismutase maturation protease
MLPSLRPGQLVIVSNFFQQLSAGNVVVIRHDRTDKIKRIKYINPGKLYLLGDNTLRSIDSRNFGWLPRSCVVGRVIWPRV